MTYWEIEEEGKLSDYEFATLHDGIDHLSGDLEESTYIEFVELSDGDEVSRQEVLVSPCSAEHCYAFPVTIQQTGCRS